MYTSNHDHFTESSYDNDDGDVEKFEYGDYEYEMSFEEFDEFESVDNESFLNDDKPENHTSDEVAAQFIEPSVPMLW
ncbi:hypothetical protein RND71_008225 [Anisodus tanguticus]|uniref:Uncharacterized protein n=1 Tax=Anisodus tanguticus TaxID=243964 RepID=A0AAE1SNF9_9SOLA|nr:hypothetical protein RND71_008225 [Anisodus tanguticus]